MKMNNKALLTMAAVAVVIAGGIIGLSTKTAQAAANITDCSDNSIIKCGASSPADFIAKTKKNATGDLQNLYTYFGLPTTGYDAFAKQAVMGTAKQDGTIVYQGRVVATKAYSLGRDKFSYSTAYQAGSKTYYKSMHTDVLRQDLPVMLWFNNQGYVQAAILTACGNPVGAVTVKPTYTCKQLNATAVSGQKFNFSANAPVSAGVTITRVVYNFGDGSAEVTKTTPSATVAHTYAKAGSYKAKVTIYVKLPGNTAEASVSGAGCEMTVVATTPQTPVTPPTTPTTPVTPPVTPTTPETPVTPETPGKGGETPATPVAEVTTLPKTGPSSIIGLFAAASIIGAIGHRVRAVRRLSKLTA